MSKILIFFVIFLLPFGFVYAQINPEIFISYPVGVRSRASSFDKSGKNSDYIDIDPSQQVTIFKYKGSGTIQRIWMTFNAKDSSYLQNAKINMVFDGLGTVSDIPLGIFTETGTWRVNDLNTPVLNIMRSRQYNRDQTGAGAGSFNINWPMPFAREAIISITNSTTGRLRMFFHVEYLEMEHLDEPLLFHADYNIVSPATPSDSQITKNTDNNFVSDHGYHAGEHGQFGKWTNFEIGTRVPLKISAPKMIESGKSADGIVKLVDLYPTLVELCNLLNSKETEQLSGTSLVPVLNNTQNEVKTHAISQTTRPLGAKSEFLILGSTIRTEKFRYNVWSEKKNDKVIAEEFYDLSTDPMNAKNLIDKFDVKTKSKL